MNPTKPDPSRDRRTVSDAVADRAATLRDALNVPADAADSAARDAAGSPTRKPASVDVENERIASAQDHDQANVDESDEDVLPGA